MTLPVTIYTTTLCPVCNMVKQLLDTLSISFVEVKVDINPLARIKLIARTKKLTVPQTNINGTWVSGFHPEQILQALQHSNDS